MRGRTLVPAPGGRRCSTRGFTLMEAVIVMAIAGVLLSVAVSSYSAQLRRSGRQEAQNALTMVANAEEQFYANNTPRTYTTDVAALGLALPVVGGVVRSGESRYDLSVAACAGDVIANCFVVQAVAPSNSAQFKDTACRTMTVDSNGRRTPATGGCW